MDSSRTTYFPTYLSLSRWVPFTRCGVSVGPLWQGREHLSPGSTVETLAHIGSLGVLGVTPRSTPGLPTPSGRPWVGASVTPYVSRGSPTDWYGSDGSTDPRFRVPRRSLSSPTSGSLDEGKGTCLRYFV